MSGCDIGVSVLPIFTERAASTSWGSIMAPAFPTAIAVEPAMHRSPAQPNAADATASTDRGMSASGITMMWFFAPPLAWTRLPLREAVS